jgi:hypothetical protein
MNDDKEIEAVDTLLKEVQKEIGRRHLLDVKYKTFIGIKEKLLHISYLLNSAPVKRDFVFDFSDVLFTFFNEHYPEWKTASRDHTNRIPRQVLQYFLAKNSSLSLKKIGILTGGYDHTTVMHSKEVVSDMLATKDKAYVVIYNNVIDFLNTKNN